MEDGGGDGLIDIGLLRSCAPALLWQAVLLLLLLCSWILCSYVRVFLLLRDAHPFSALAPAAGVRTKA